MQTATPGTLTIARIEGPAAGLTLTARLADGAGPIAATVAVAPVFDAAGDALDAYTAMFSAPADLPVTLQWLQDAIIVGSETIVELGSELVPIGYAIAGQPTTSVLEDAPAGLTITARLVDGDAILPTVVTVTAVLDADGLALNAYTAAYVAPADLPVALQWLQAGVVVGSEIIEATQRSATFDGVLLVTLEDLKEHLNIPASNTVHDAKLVRWLHGVRPVIEALAGPIVPATFEEWHDGGSPTIQVRRRPSTTYGTTPVLTLISVTEYIGSGAYELAVVAHPGAGSTYSVMFDRLGTLTRRTSGGGRGAFAGGERSVHVVYVAGQQSVPANVYEATLELARVNYHTTQATGRGQMTVADDQDNGPALGFYVPRRVRELLAPNRRHPSIA